MAVSKGIRKILVLSPSLQATGGVQSYTKTLVGDLEEILGKSQVRTVAVPGDAKARKDGSLILSKSIKVRFVIRAFINAFSWHPDLIVCTHLGTATVARLIGRYTDIPYWLVLHGIEVWGALTPGKSRALHEAQRYVALTRFTLDAVAARHVDGLSQMTNRLPSLILPPPLAKLQPASFPANRFTVSDSRPTVLTVGRLASTERYKGHDVMLDAWPSVLRRVPDAVYLIVGEGDDRQRLQSRARDLGIADSVHFTGKISADELNACYERCQVFAMPARTELNADVPRGEGFGIVFLEAMAHAKPVLGPNTGAPTEFIRAGEHGLLVNPADSAEVAQALVELLEDPTRAQRMGESAREWVVSEFTREKFRERLRNALQEG